MKRTLCGTCTSFFRKWCEHQVELHINFRSKDNRTVHEEDCEALEDKTIIEIVDKAKDGIIGDKMCKYLCFIQMLHC